MSSQPANEQAMTPSIEEIASEVSSILLRRLNVHRSSADIVKLLQVVFLTRAEVAELLRVKPATIDTWVSRKIIPVRYANGYNKSEPRFLLPEILAWTLPEDDPHASYRLAHATACKIANSNRPAAVSSRKEE
jgi:hypothetical protein